jgi:hypothetical protein
MKQSEPRHLRVNVDDVAVSESGVFLNGIHKNSWRLGGEGESGGPGTGPRSYFRLEPVG